MIEQTLDPKDLKLGDRFESDTYTITKAEIIEFAEKYDPQYFHVDEDLAKDGPFGELISSGWLTVNIGMRLWLESTQIKHGWLGGSSKMKWSAPVKPGDTIRVNSKITSLKLSKSDPNRLNVVFELTGLNQDDHVVMEQETVCFAYLKPFSEV